MSSELKTGVVFDDRMIEHECTWDPEHVEKPERYVSSLQRCKDYGLVDRCTMIPSRFATEEELQLVHFKKYINDVKDSTNINNEDDFEAFASQYDSTYFNKKTYDSALLAAGSTLQLVSSVLNGTVNNGMAIVRPPGHHAMPTEACGFCFFNNVAIAAKYALEHFNLSRILIVDWDVHHGQATQHMFYDDPRVLYFSIHRYQNGAFWPHLRESNFDFIGGDSAKGFNINVPLNGNGQGNAEYFAIFNNILLPIAYEFSPELVLVSAGYDAALGCPEGEMRVTPQAYPHFINSLSCLANGRMCVILEGGYCISSLSESVALTLRSLLGDPCPLIDACLGVNQISVDSILNVLSVLRLHWESVRLQPTYRNDVEYNGEKHFVHIEYTGSPLEGLSVFLTRGYNPIMLPHVVSLLESEIKELIKKTDLSVPSHRTCFIFSSKHKHSLGENEKSPEGIKNAADVLGKFFDSGVLSKCTYLDVNKAVESDFTDIVDNRNINKIKSTWKLSDEIRMLLEQKFPQNLCQTINDDLLQLVDAVMNRICVNGFSLTYSSIVRHSEDKSKFCKFNEVALAASYLVEKYFLKRILIIDWSTDHNNNIQQIFYEDDKILSISIHYCGRKNCPMLFEEVGSNKGKGYNINIPFTHAVIDGDYLSALFHIIIPVAYEFCPEFVLITSAFNNESFSLLSSSCYGIMTKLLNALSNGRMIVDIEGWNHDNTFEEAVSCISSLVGDTKVPITSGTLKPCPEAVETIQKVVKVQRKYWKSLAFYTALPTKISSEVKMIKNEIDLKPRQSSDPVAIPRRQDEPGSSKMDEWIGEASGFSSHVEMFCVTPLEYCPHLELLQPIPSEGMNPFARCNSCNDPSENWVCLHCYQVYCGRFINQHMMQHGLDMGHFLTLSYSDLSVWCYACDAYIHNRTLVPIKQHAHDKKFREI